MIKRIKKGKGIKNLLACASTAFVVLLILATLLVVLGKISGISVLPYAPVWVLSGSMEDTIPARSYILIHYVDADAVEVGDVITFVSPDPALGGMLNTHRVVEILGDHASFVTRGDAAVENDPYAVPADAVRAVYVRQLPVLTFFGRIFSSVAGFAATILVSTLLCTLWTVYYFKKETARVKQARIDALVAEQVARLEAARRETEQRQRVSDSKSSTTGERNS